MASRPSDRMAFRLSVFVTLALFLAEGSGLVAGVLPAAVFELVLAVVLLGLHAWRPSTGAAPLLPALALACLVRPVSLAAAVPTAPVLGWYVLAGLPLLAGAILGTRLVTTPAAGLHLRIRRPLFDLSIVAMGPLLGLLGYVALRPSPLFAAPGVAEMAAFAVVMFVFGAFTEELIFRGLVLNAALDTVHDRRAAVVLAAVLPAALYVGDGSLLYPPLIAAIGLVFGAALLRGGSLWAISASHGAMLVVMGLLAQLLSH